MSRFELSPIPNSNYVCPRCHGQTRPIDGRPVTQVGVDGTLLDVEASFCYLGNLFSAGGGCSLAIIYQVCTAWGKFKKLLPILISKHISLTVRGKVFDACVRSALLHGSETWAPTAPDLQRRRRNDRSMIRWICGVKSQDDMYSEVLVASFCICCAFLPARGLVINMIFIFFLQF